MTLQKKTQSLAEQKFGAVATKMTGMAGEVGVKAGQQWDKLESIFEERVARALKSLGVPSGTDISSLIARIDGLAASIGFAPKKKAAPVAKAKTAVKKVAAKATKTATKVVAKAEKAAAPTKKAVAKKVAAVKKAAPAAAKKVAAPVKKAAAPVKKAVAKKVVAPVEKAVDAVKEAVQA
jgi:hypothetical protein